MKTEKSKDKSNPDYVVNVGVDDGHYGIKLAVEPGVVTEFQGSKVDPKKIFCLYMPSRVTVGQVSTGIDGDERSLYSVTSHGRQVSYTVIGDDHVTVQQQDTRTKDYAVSDELLVLVHHALLLAGLGGRKVRIATGLPYNRFFLSGQSKNEKLIADKTKHLLQNVPRNMNANVRLAQIEEHLVMPEAVAGFHDQLTDDAGQVNQKFYERIQMAPVAFLDVGGNTTDIAVIKVGGRGIDDSRSFTIEAGGLHVETEAIPALRAWFEMEPSYVIPRKLVEAAVRTGKVRLLGREREVHQIVDPLRANHALRIVNEISAKLKGAWDLDAVYLIGGGSLLLGDHLVSALQEGQAVTVENAQFANARGFLKKMLYL
jgi:plasmid segregation protein ParM